MRRIIVTGERDWVDASAVEQALACEFALHPNEEFRVSHGDCPSGADAMAEAFCRRVGIPTDKYPADWKAQGPKAGPERNQRMVNVGGDIVLAFWSGRTTGPNGRGRSGTLDTISRASIAGIKVRIVPRGKS